MDESDKLSKLIAVLTKARADWSDTHPGDMDTFNELSAMLTDCHQRFDELTTNPAADIPSLSADEQKELSDAVDTLEKAVLASQGADAVIQAATTLAGL